VLNEHKGGMSPSIWRGVDMQEASALLKAAQTGIASKSLRDAVTRLLLSSVEAPAGDANNLFLQQRIHALTVMGNGEAALRMLDAVPASMQDDALKRLRFEALLLTSDREAACALAQHEIETSSEMDWQKNAIFCRAADGRHDEARLGIDLLEEQGQKPEKWFYELVAALRDADGKVKTVPDNLAMVDYAMLLVAGAGKIPADALDAAAIGKAPAGLLGYVAAISALPAVVRAQVLERAVLFGAADAKELQAVYAEIHTNAKPIKGDAVPEGVEGRAMLVTQMMAEPAQDKKLALVARIFDAYDAAGLYSVAQQIVAIPLATITPSGKESQAVAADVYAALRAAGNEAAARRWSGTSAGLLWLGKALSDLGGDGSGVLPDVTLGKAATASEVKRVWRLYTLMPVFGYNLLGTKAGSEMAFTANYQLVLPSPMLLAQLTNLAQTQQAAALLLVSAQLLGSQDISRLHDTAVAEMVRALKVAGLGKEARALAVESVLTQH
jgi:hypothetical protein